MRSSLVSRARFGIVLCGLLLLVHPAFAERAADPRDATVFIRVIGRVRVQVDSSWDNAVDEKNIEIGTGSGFVFTPFGHVLTNQHVVSSESTVENVRGHSVTIDLTVDRVEVVLPSGDLGGGAVHLEATVEVSDPDADLAILSVTGAELPYVAFGDSDAVQPGENVSVYGFPFGRDVEVGKTNLPDIVPTVSVSRGSVSATRADDVGNTAYLQTSAVINPGNSGGPMVDSEGYALGVVRLKLRGGDGIGFAIPVNSVKDFLDTHGYSGLLPTERLRLGGEERLAEKGLTLRLPETIEDRSPARLTVFSDPSENTVRFFADRVATDWDLPRLEQTMLSGAAFGPFRQTGAQSSSTFASGHVLAGHATGQDGSGRESKIEYALFESGPEKVVVRYIGSAEAMAFNRSVFLASLQSVAVEPLLTAPLSRALRPEEVPLVQKPLPSPAAPFVLLPETWVDEPSTPFPCRGLPPVDSALSASMAQDFTVSLRAGWWRTGGDPVAASRACSERPGPYGASSYAYRVDWLGVSYVVAGRFVLRGERLMQLELVAPAEKEPLARDFARYWIEENEKLGVP